MVQHVKGIEHSGKNKNDFSQKPELNPQLNEDDNCFH